MKTTQRALALVLALILALGWLCGCGAAVQMPSETDGAQQPFGDVQTPDADAPDDAEPEGSDRSDEPAPVVEIDEDGTYTTTEDVALYLHTYGRLPDNFITKQQARAQGWEGGPVEPYGPGMCIGGDRFGNYEGLLPDAEGRIWRECDIDTLGGPRGAKRIVYSNDGLIYYTDDHYESFERLYGDP